MLFLLASTEEKMKHNINISDMTVDVCSLLSNKQSTHATRGVDVQYLSPPLAVELK